MCATLWTRSSGRQLCGVNPLSPFMTVPSIKLTSSKFQRIEFDCYCYIETKRDMTSLMCECNVCLLTHLSKHYVL